ncbi:hypothetical protein AXG93_4079s1250 [Marchantia polymorpha subsp. ruderalis]|uniref:Cilia- and flagella-associated protein 43 n=1 Tax=Marchantia polymorpha subsp. ruderalis TaxID=1480154 RepID=A0A176VV78_MARPO|nr:hypothetical protein AXG93_4079s1250 [Marchantia polymorpha subsp. ruderalis]
MAGRQILNVGRLSGDGDLEMFGFGYPGTPLHYVSHHSALGICGNALMFYSLSGGQNRHLMWGPGYGISVTAYSPCLDFIAYALKYCEAVACSRDIATKKELLAGMTADLAEVEVTCLAFSVDGSRLVTASSEPDFKLILWDIDKEKRTVTKLIGDQTQWCPRNRVFFTGKQLLAGSCVPESHTWATHSDIIYVGCQEGELLSFNVKPPEPPKLVVSASKEKETKGRRAAEKDTKDKEEIVEVKVKDLEPKWQHLITLDDPGGPVTHVCARDGHLVVVGDGGLMRWVTVPREPVEKKKKEGGKKAKKKRKRMKRDGKEDKSKGDESEDLKSDDSAVDKEARVVCELALNVPEVKSMEYREDGLQLLIGASNGLIATVRVNQQILEPQLSATSPDLLPTLTSMERGAEIDWESEHHEGAVMALGFIRGAKFMVTAGKDSTVRVWTSDRGKELSRACLKAAQTCMATSEKHNIVATGAANGFINVLKVDQIGRNNVFFNLKLHTGSLDQISFSHTEHFVVTASKADGRFFFCSNKSGDFENLELLGYIVLPNPILAHTWDIPAQDSSDLFVLLSLARGELVKLKLPVDKAPNGGLVFDGPALRQISFRIPIPLNAIASGKYYLEKEEVERRVVWGFGIDKKLQQYRLPDNFSAWTGSDAMPHAAHFNIPGHLKPGHALVLGTFEGVLVTGGEDGAIQIRSQVFDPLQAPQKVLDVRLYDGFTGGITSIAVVNGRIYTGGANGVIFCCDTSQCGLRRGKQVSAGDLPPRTKAVRVNHQPEDEQSAELSVVQIHDQNVETRYMQAGQAYRASLTGKIQQIKQAFNLIYEENERAPELEKLTPKELLVDTELEAQLRDKLQKAVTEVVEKVKISDAKKDILAARIKQECYESMADPEVTLQPFCTGYPVQSFPIRKEAGFSPRLAYLAKQLRIIELREMHYTKQLNKKLAKEAAILAAKEAEELAAQEAAKNAAFSSAMLDEGSASDAVGEGEFTNRSRDSIYEDGESVVEETKLPEQSLSGGEAAGGAPVSRRESVSEGAGNAARRPDGEEGGAVVVNADDSTVTAPPTTTGAPVDDDDDDMELSISENSPADSFLYGTFELTTSKRKRLQRFFLFMQLQEIRSAFNAKMVASKTNKIQLIQKIHELQVRIKDLYRMLGGQGECPLLQINESVEGMPDIFEIKDEEVKVKKYLNKAERAKAEEMRLVEEEQAKLRAGSDAAERALHDMMGGKLEKKVEIISVEAEVQRPAWMSGNPKGFTKEQHKEVKDFDQFLKQLKEEKEKKIRGQESEQRKLMNDIQEMTSAFDKEILDLFNQRCQDEVRCTAIEESIARFSGQVEIEEFSDEKREYDLSKTMEKLKSAKAQSVSALTEFRREVDAFRNEYEAAVAEDRLQDKSFRKLFSDCGDQINELYKAFQRRPMKPSELQPKEKKQSINSLSPERRPSLKAIQAQASRRGSLMGPPRKAAPQVIIDPFYEKPPEVTAAQWERLVEVRGKKIIQEEEVKKLTVVMNEMQGCLNELTSADDTNRRKIESALRELAEFREGREKKRRNLIVPLHIKQGLVEAELKPLEGEYSNVSLMPRSVIVECNEIVMTEANSKIDMMKRMKAWKAENNLIRWEIARLRLQQRLVAEKIRHLQLLRVTKASQMVIKTGEDPTSASEALALANRQF